LVSLICIRQLADLLMWGVLSDERTVLPFTFASGPRQRSLCRVRVPSDSRPCFTLSDSKLPFSWSPTTPPLHHEERADTFLSVDEFFYALRAKRNVALATGW
jgi:hypothetical protein